MALKGDRSKPIPTKGYRCKGCLGTAGQHTGDEGCWCPRCLTKPEGARCRVWEPIEVDGMTPLVDREVVPFSHAHPDTSREMASRVIGRSGTLRQMVYSAIRDAGGATDDELEKMLSRSHQSVSGSRNSLMNDGLIEDSGRRIQTRYGFRAIVWVVVDDDATLDFQIGQD